MMFVDVVLPAEASSNSRTDSGRITSLWQERLEFGLGTNLIENYENELLISSFGRC
jgi:hypothetical protein